MESLKKPEVIIGSANAVALLIVTAWFYNQNNTLNQKVDELSKKLSKTIVVANELHKYLPALNKLPEDLTELRGIDERLAKRVKTMQLQISEQTDILLQIIENIETNNGSKIKHDLQPIAPKRSSSRRKRKSRSSKKKVRYEDSESESDSDSDSDSDTEAFIADLRKRRRR